MSCRDCGASVLLDSTRMHLDDCRATMPCPKCGALIPVRRLDAQRPPPDGIWTIAAYVDGQEPEADAKSKPTGLARVFHGRRSHHV